MRLISEKINLVNPKWKTTLCKVTRHAQILPFSFLTRTIENMINMAASNPTQERNKTHRARGTRRNHSSNSVIVLWKSCSRKSRTSSTPISS